MSARLRATPWFRDTRAEARARAEREYRINFPPLPREYEVLPIALSKQNEDLLHWLDERMKSTVYFIWKGNPV